VWISGHDATDLEAGVHCDLISNPFARKAARAVKLLEDLIGG
jgi:hypothetical protein